MVVTGAEGPQNWMLEMSGVFPLPTGGRPSFENVPEVCAGSSVVSFDPGPPLTSTPEIGRVEDQSPPVASASEMVTTDSLPAGFSNT